MVDDEPKNLELLAYCIEKYTSDIEIAATFSKKQKAEEYLNNNENLQDLDILFLDMILDEGTGFDLLDSFDHSDVNVVICTAHDEFALKAIQYEVVDYLLKPIEIQDLKLTIDKIKQKQKKSEKSLYDANAIAKFSRANFSLDKPVMIKNRNAIEIVSSKDIVFVEASYVEGGKTAVILRDESVKPCSVMLSKIESILDPNVFYRLNRSHIVNLREISKIERGFNFVCVMSNGFKLPIPRNKYKNLLNRIESLFGMAI